MAISDWAGGQELEHRQVRSPVESRVPEYPLIVAVWNKQVGFTTKSKKHNLRAKKG